ncbi:Glutathione S-transferase [hydrothermal vent metagenome]|uniref:Glutathione S-transferase n=1 Tax=hydrothermal vent metagenome TaxID=652676 RepID=A0A3B0T2K7_9ZZZZ
MYTIVIGNKNYSSWSLRGWLAVKAAGAPYEEVLIPLETEEWDKRIGDFSPSRCVPVLIDGDVTVWDSLAIIESLAERHPEAGFWPQEAVARAHARSAAAEMHSGFTALRGACPMNFRRAVEVLPLADAVKADVARISTIWGEARATHGQSGPYLYGEWSAADMMFAPVVSRFRTYGIDAGPVVAAYVAAVEAHPHYVEWRDEGLKETWVVPSDEID